MRYVLDLNNTEFEVMKLFNKEVLFTPDRINKETVPKGVYVYEVRHDDESVGDIVQLGKGILVNFYGTIITKEPIQLDGNYKDIDEEHDLGYTNKVMSVSEFMKTKNKQREER